MEDKYVLQMENISKKYGETAVLKNVSLNVKPGEIYALIGENGAGKSTLMNILFGMSVIHSTGGYDGKVTIDGQEVNFTSPNDAMKAGIGMVHQEFMLIPGFTVTENIKVGRELTKPGLASKVFGKSLERLDWEKMEGEAQEALDAIGMDIDRHVKVAGLPVGYMQFVEIAREIDKKNIKLLVFDEPTAVLTESEAQRLLSVMKLIAAKGIAIIFITHRLDEIMEVADTMTILRDGEWVETKAIKDTDVVEIAQLMVGRKIEKLVDDDEKPEGLESAPVAVEIRDFRVDMPGEKVKGVDLDIRQGEIFGIGGLAGQGKIGIPNGIMGLFPATGTVTIFGSQINFGKLGDALHKEVAFVSEDRRGVGLLLDESIEDNIVFNTMTVKKEFLKNYAFMKLKDGRRVRSHAQEMINLFDIRCTGSLQKVGSLSGGNQQKVCLAGALTLNPKLLIVSEPTRGIDIGAKKLIMEHLVKLRKEQGLTIIMVSSELVELRSICDRIAIISDGRLSKILSPDAPDADFGLAMSAVRTEGGA
ncbi:simple sugar transport system ATP-binding protein [Lachnospiraceae bacterium PF1-21]|uniref:Sugar ABC transporter ATP-binding protein n=1 Tax=Ohessyouella blattaphilus TaxID=2949333 RepID=A0ABT1EH47_9FIRM|nr:sugar ABC transporter ATP-binding protein [Ohessyouella blattaphilus]MCP1109819.1 sugar ABC transporter ATP-binding protein [Ohessyouella blattaphilus]MCR8563213.1 sugar ABC transporter ATP-binding protein [Ohessyouella blattaphilus]